MKTLKLFTLTILIALAATVSAAEKYNETKIEVKTTEQLQNTISDIVKADFKKENCFLSVNNVWDMNEKVETQFYISTEGEIQIMKIDSDDYLAGQYVKKLFHEKQIDASNLLKNRAYRISIVINYSL